MMHMEKDRGEPRPDLTKERLPVDLAALVESSVFATLNNEEINIASGGAASFLTQNSKVALFKQEAIDYFGIDFKTPQETFYALMYIFMIPIIVRGRVIMNDPNRPEEDKKLAEQTANDLQATFNAFGDLFEGKPVRQDILPNLPGSIRSMRLSQADMRSALIKAEIQYGKKKLAEENEKMYTLDYEHSSIPAMPQKQWEAIVKVRDIIMDNWITATHEIFQADLSARPDEAVSKESRDRIIGEINAKTQMPQSVTQIFSDLGLTLDNKLHMHYALLYISRMAAIKNFKNKPIVSHMQQDEISEGIKNFAQLEAMLQYSVLSGISRDEMMQVRAKVEEAFQRNPLALGQVEELPVQGLQKEEFEEIYQQVKVALVRMRSEAKAPPLNSRLAKNKLGERMAQDAMLVLQRSQKGGSLPSREHTLFAKTMGAILDRMRAPELLNLYRRITRNQPVSETLQSFVNTINQKDIPSYLLRQAGVSRQDIQRFVDSFDIISFEGNTDAEYLASSVFHTLLEVLDILQTAGQDYSDRKTVEAYKKEMKGTRGELIGSGLFGAFQSYLHPDTVQAFIERSGFNSLLSSTPESGT